FPQPSLIAPALLLEPGLGLGAVRQGAAGDVYHEVAGDGDHVHPRPVGGDVHQQRGVRAHTWEVAATDVLVVPLAGVRAHHQDVVLVASVRVVRVGWFARRPVRAEEAIHVMTLDTALQRLVGERGTGPGEREHTHERDQQSTHQRVAATFGRVPRPPA